MENPDHHQQPSSISSNPNQQNSSEEDRDQLQVQVTSAAAAAAAAATVTSTDQSGTRLYECSFCKKGFSNAQALGGHMNIHRKDKAKLKQAARENNQRDVAGQRKMTSPLTTSNPSSSVLREDEHHHRHQLSYESQVALAELKQLPLLEETGDTYKSIEYYSIRDQDQPVINQGSFEAPELDLELRLGVHEPHTKPAVALGVRKFF